MANEMSFNIIPYRTRNKQNLFIIWNKLPLVVIYLFTTPPISTKQTITSFLISRNTKKETTTYDFGLGQAQTYGGVI